MLKIYSIHIQKQKKKKISNIYQKVEKLENHITFLYDLILKYKGLLKQLVDENQEFENIIMSNLLQMSYEIFKESETSYLVLLKYLPFLPSVQKVKEFQGNNIDLTKYLTNLDDLKEIITFCKKEKKIHGYDKIYECLTVGALF